MSMSKLSPRSGWMLSAGSSMFVEKPTPGSKGDWGPIRAAMHFFFGDGSPKVFSHDSKFSKYVANHKGIKGGIKWAYKNLQKEVETLYKGLKNSSCTHDIHISGYGGPYEFTGDTKGKGTLGSGRGNDPTFKGADPDYSRFTFTAECCIKKPCADILPGKVNCKVLFVLEDKYTYDDGPEIDKFGTDFWHIVYFYKDYGASFRVKGAYD